MNDPDDSRPHLKRYRSITKNSVRCRHCKEVLTSRKLHHTQRCGCGKVMISGGMFKLYRFCHETDYDELSEFFYTYSPFERVEERQEFWRKVPLKSKRFPVAGYLPTPSSRTFGQNLQEYRIAVGFTLDHLSEVTRITKQRLMGAEYGEANLSLLEMDRISYSLGIPLSVLFEEN